jgi:hypothetical protein
VMVKGCTSQLPADGSTADRQRGTDSDRRQSAG